MSTWTLTRRGATALATFNRPPRNFMSFAAMGELESVLTMASDESVNVLVLTGGVPGYFVAHADLDDLTRWAGASRSRAIRAAEPGLRPAGDHAAAGRRRMAAGVGRWL